MAVTEKVDLLIAEAHACGDMVHVNAEIPLTVEQSKALRKEMRAAEARAEVNAELIEAGNEHVNDVFKDILGGIIRIHGEGPASGE